jgi:uncharacterized RDD family membrane protein YckC
VSAAPPNPEVVENVFGLRAIAATIDIVVLILLGGVLSTLAGEQNEDGGFTSGLNGWVFWLYIALCFAYFSLFETISGQSLGKKAMGLRVVSLSGVLTPRQALVRSLFRVVDGLPFLVPYLVGAVVSVSNQRHQRVGDMAAGTLVIRA